MSESILSKRWPWLTGGALVIAVFILTVFEFRFGPRDTRATGDADDIVALAARDDVNVLFILIDTLRADRMGMYGYERDTTPILDHVSSKGILFAKHLAQSSWTKCSMASLWTGLYPKRVGVTRFEHVLPDEAHMPAEILRESGFATAGLFRNGWVEGYFGFDQGFDLYNQPMGSPIPWSVRRENPTMTNSGTDLDLVEAANEFLRIRGDERWFLYLHLMDVHEYLYDEDTALFGTGYADIYDNAIRRTDFVLSQLLIDLEERGHLEDTIVVIAADHGEAMGERGYEGHARRVYRESTEVPLIISLPFKLEPGVVIRSRTQNVDIWPTVLDLLGLPALEHADGVSRLPQILAAARGNAAPAPATPSYAHLDQTWGRRQASPRPTVAVSEGDFRFVVTRDERGRAYEELFDAAGDAAELQNVAADQPEIAERLRRLAKTYLEGEPPWSADIPALELNEIQLQQLRALGYQVP